MHPDAEGNETENGKLEIPDAEKIEKLGAAIASYFALIADLIMRPAEHARKKDLKLDGKVMVFSIMSLVGSTTLFGLSVEHLKPKIAPFLTICVVTLLSWAGYGAFSHLICWMLRGKAHLKTTIALVMEIL